MPQNEIFIVQPLSHRETIDVAERNMGLADLHIHSIYSYDGTASIASILARARQVGLNVIAITDHDAIKGSLQAVDLAPKFGIEVIPGIEITTAQGDLLALFVTNKVERGLSLIGTIMRVGELGGICIAPHPMARGMGMNSLSDVSILRALTHPDAARILIGIEMYNATAFDRATNHHAERILEEHPCIAQVGNSDAHILEAIGLGATEFLGCTAADLLDALWIGATDVRRGAQFSSARILRTWAMKYLISGPARQLLANK
jgi:predicted metal-dependent phosphoesterase TrpH